ncbi:MAG: DMT family transporter, partial [Acidiferrobacterales bacterium]
TRYCKHSTASSKLITRRAARHERPSYVQELVSPPRADSSAEVGASHRWKVLPYLLLAIAPLTWAGNFVVGRFIHDQVPPVSLNLCRWLVALVALLPFTAPILLAQRHLILRHWKLLALLGATGIALFHSFVYQALHFTGAINAALVLSTTPVVIVALSWILFRDPVTARQALGVMVSLLGAVIIVMRGDLGLLLQLQFNKGDLWMLAAVPNWALYSVLLRRLPPGFHPMGLLAATVTFGLILLIPVYLWELARVGTFQVNVATVGSVLYMGFFASVIAYVCWNQGVATIGATRAGLFLHLVPVFSAALAVAILGESVRAFHLVGITLVFAGIYLTNTARPTSDDARALTRARDQRG